jgi:cyclohexanecarboxyl-CoA dehydrogenase
MAQLFDTNRAYIGLKCIGAAQASVDETCEFAKDRQVMGNAIASYQGVSFPLVEAETRLEAARLLCYKALWLRDQGMPNSKEGGM